MSFKKLLLIFFVFIAISFALYGNTIGGEFVYDDVISVANRSELADSSHLLKIWGEPYKPGFAHEGVYRPLAVLSFGFNYIFFGKDPASFHVVNIILNGLAVFLVFLVSWKLFKNKVLAIFISLIFAFLPIHTEAVAFIKARDDVLSSIFSLASIYVFLKAIEQTGKRRAWMIILSSLLFFLAVMAKEFAIMVPLLLLAIYWIKEKPKFKKLILTGLFFVPTGIIYLFIRWLVLKEYAFGYTQTFWFYTPMQYIELPTRTWTAFKMLFMYIQKTLMPINLSATQHFNSLTLVDNPLISWETLVGIILILILAIIIWRKNLRESSLGVGAILFFVPYLIFSKFLLPGGEIFAERWMYLPSFGLAIILGSVFYKAYKQKRVVAVLFLSSILLIYGFITIQRNNVWLSEKALYESMIHDAPKSVQGYIGLAYWNFYRNNKEESRGYLNLAQQIYHDIPKLLDLEAIFAKEDNDGARAKKAFSKSLELAPSTDRYVNYASFLIEKGEYEKSVEVLGRFFGSKFYNPDSLKGTAVRSMMVVSLIKLGRNDEAKIYENSGL